MAHCLDAGSIARGITDGAAKAQFSVNSQLSIGQHSDSAVLLLIRDDHLLKVTHQGAKLATHESCVAEHSLEFIIGICVAVRRGTEHRHTESRWSGRGNAVRIGHEVNRDRSTVRGKSRMDFFEQPFASSHIKVMKEVCEKYQVVTTAVIDLEGAARDCAIAIIYSRFQSIFLCYGKNALQSIATTSARLLRRAISIPYIP